MRAIAVATGVAIAAAVCVRVAHVRAGARTIPVYPGAREGGGRTRYWPHLISWDDRSSARVDRVFALPEGVTLVDIARRADPTLTADGWYLVTPDTLDAQFAMPPQVVMWQRDPNERLDLSQLWPLAGISRAERLYGGIFPSAFLDAPLVVGWTWSFGGSRSPRPAPPQRAIVRRPPSPHPRDE